MWTCIESNGWFCLPFSAQSIAFPLTTIYFVFLLVQNSEYLHFQPPNRVADREWRHNSICRRRLHTAIGIIITRVYFQPFENYLRFSFLLEFSIKGEQMLGSWGNELKNVEPYPVIIPKSTSLRKCAYWSHHTCFCNVRFDLVMTLRGRSK